MATYTTTNCIEASMCKVKVSPSRKEEGNLGWVQSILSTFIVCMTYTNESSSNNNIFWFTRTRGFASRGALEHARSEPS